MKAKVILFRADSSSSIGTGHIMRDLVLAKKYADKGAKIIFATQNLKGNLNQIIVNSGYKVVVLDTNKFKTLNSLLQKKKPDLLIIDSYDIDYKFEKKIKSKNPDLKLMVLDDTYEKHYCDILLNHNIYAKKKRYKNLLPKNSKVYCGANYTLLRQEFLDAKKTNYKKGKKLTVFLSLGGADKDELNIPILKALKNFKNIKVHLVTTLANKNLKKLKKFVKKKKWIKLHINSNKVATLMAKSHFGVVTPSVVLNELYFMELPYFVIQTASNQSEMVKYIKGLNR